MSGRRRQGEAGFTLVELLCYLALFASFTVGLVGAEVMAGRINRAEAALLRTLGEVDRLFAELAVDCDRATDVAPAVAGAGEVKLAGAAATYAIDAGKGTISRNGGPVVGDVVTARFECDAKSPRLLRVSLRVRQGGREDAFDRSFERAFFMPNAGAAAAAGGSGGQRGSF